MELSGTTAVVSPTLVEIFSLSRHRLQLAEAMKSLVRLVPEKEELLLSLA